MPNNDVIMVEQKKSTCSKETGPLSSQLRTVNAWNLHPSTLPATIGTLHPPLLATNPDIVHRPRSGLRTASVETSTRSPPTIPLSHLRPGIQYTITWVPIINDQLHLPLRPTSPTHTVASRIHTPVVLRFIPLLSRLLLVASLQLGLRQREEDKKCPRVQRGHLA
jgi:hypothetical protein